MKAPRGLTYGRRLPQPETGRSRSGRGCTTWPLGAEQPSCSCRPVPNATIPGWASPAGTACAGVLGGTVAAPQSGHRGCVRFAGQTAGLPYVLRAPPSQSTFGCAGRTIRSSTAAPIPMTIRGGGPAGMSSGPPPGIGMQPAGPGSGRHRSAKGAWLPRTGCAGVAAVTNRQNASSFAQRRQPVVPPRVVLDSRYWAKSAL